MQVLGDLFGGLRKILQICGVISHGVINNDFIMNIDEHINSILNGTEDLPKFNQPEHAGVCSAGPLLVGAILVCDFTRESLSAGRNVRDGETAPANWEIDEAQEQNRNLSHYQRGRKEVGVKDITLVALTILAVRNK